MSLQNSAGRPNALANIAFEYLEAEGCKFVRWWQDWLEKPKRALEAKRLCWRRVHG